MVGSINVHSGLLRFFFYCGIVYFVEAHLSE